MKNDYYINQQFVAEDGQELFTLSKPYYIDSLIVTVNGLSLTKDEHFVSHDSLTIRLLEPCVDGDCVGVQSLFTTKQWGAEVVGRKSALVQKYHSEELIKGNSEYEISLIINNTPVKWEFRTKLSPYYSTIKRIRIETGDTLNKTPDAYIDSIIYASSLAAKELWDENNDAYQESSVPAAVQKYAKLKTCIDIVYNIYLSIGANYGTSKKLIGEISIEKTTKLPYIDELLKKFQKEFDAVEAEITHREMAIETFVKASTRDPFQGRTMWDAGSMVTEYSD